MSWRRVCFDYANDDEDVLLGNDLVSVVIFFVEF